MDPLQILSINSLNATLENGTEIILKNNTTTSVQLTTETADQVQLSFPEGYEIFTETGETISSLQLSIFLSHLGILIPVDFPNLKDIQILRNYQGNTITEPVMPTLVLISSEYSTIINLPTYSAEIQMKGGELVVNGSVHPDSSSNSITPSMKLFVLRDFVLLTPQITATAVGDPFVRIFGMDKYIYKIPGAVATYRLFDYNGIIVNATISALNESEKIKMTEIGRFYDGFFFETFAINYKNKHTIIYDRNIKQINAENDTIFKISTREPSVWICPLQGKQICQSVVINIQDVEIVLRKFESPEVINGIDIGISDTPNILSNIKGLMNSISHPKKFKIGNIENFVSKPQPIGKPYQKTIDTTGWAPKWLMMIPEKTTVINTPN